MSTGDFNRCLCYKTIHYPCYQCCNGGIYGYAHKFTQFTQSLKPHLCPKCDGNGMTLGQYKAHVECNVCKGKGVLWG